MASKRRRNFGNQDSFTTSFIKSPSAWKIIAVLILAAFIFFFGVGTFLLTLSAIFFGPKIGGIPIWAIAILLLMFMFLSRRRY